MGWVNTARYKWASLTGREIKFRPATFYLGIADWLASDVEGIPKQDRYGKVCVSVQVTDGVPAGKLDSRQELLQEQGTDSSAHSEPGILFYADEEISPTSPPPTNLTPPLKH